VWVVMGKFSAGGDGALYFLAVGHPVGFGY
jgi:hypothetical protein